MASSLPVEMEDLSLAEGSPVEEKTDRHCAFCLKLVPAEDVKICSGCHRRAYCGKKCQKMDWKSKTGDKYDGAKGQGHKDWCALPCGEEDLDWEVKRAGNGKGLFAKRKIPSGSRIMVDGLYIPDLSKVEGDDLPSYLDAVNNDDPMKRNNDIYHACFSNADRMPLLDFRVQVVYAKEDIEAGEEITVSYVPLQQYFFTLDKEHNVDNIGPSPELAFGTFEGVRKVLRLAKMKCRRDCFCRKEESKRMLRSLQQACKHLREESLICDCKFTTAKAKNGIFIFDKILEDMKTFNSGLISRAFILEKGFFFARRRRETSISNLVFIACDSIFRLLKEISLVAKL